MRKVVAYFSATGTTAAVAKTISEVASADLYEIQPKVKYTSADLDWRNSSSRSSVEMKNRDELPEIVVGDFDSSRYDVVFLGFPIWWYVAPTVINAFLKAYDFSNKKIVLFATSGGSGFGSTARELKDCLPNSTTILEGKLIRGRSRSEIEAWIKGLNL